MAVSPAALERRLELLHALDELLGALVVGPAVSAMTSIAYAIAVGVCITLRTLPPPGVHVHAARQARDRTSAPPA